MERSNCRQYFWFIFGGLLILAGCYNSNTDTFHIVHEKTFYSFLGLDKSMHMKIDSNEAQFLVKNDTLISTDFIIYKIRPLKLNNVAKICVPHPQGNMDAYSQSEILDGNFYWTSPIDHPHTIYCRNIANGKDSDLYVNYYVNGDENTFVDNERIYFSGMDGVFIYSKKSEQKIVEFRHESSKAISSSVNCLVADSMIYVTGIQDSSWSNSYIIVYNLNQNKVIWKVMIKGENYGKILLSGDNLLLQAEENGGELICFDKNTGEKKWVDGKVDVTLPDLFIYNGYTFCQGGNMLKCINVNTGGVKWERKYNFRARDIYIPLIFHDGLYLEEEDAIYHVDISTGNVINSVKTDTRDIECVYDEKMHSYLRVGGEIFW